MMLKFINNEEAQQV